MMESKPVLWFAEDRKPNSFFFRSPYRSWKFLVSAGLSSVVVLVFTGITWRYYDELNRKTTTWLILSGLLMQNVVYPFVQALRRHRKINDLYAVGYITEQTAGTPLDEILEVADNALNEGLRNTACVFGLLVICVMRWKLG